MKNTLLLGVGMAVILAVCFVYVSSDSLDANLTQPRRPDGADAYSTHPSRHGHPSTPRGSDGRETYQARVFIDVDVDDRFRCGAFSIRGSNVTATHDRRSTADWVVFIDSSGEPVAVERVGVGASEIIELETASIVCRDSQLNALDPEEVEVVFGATRGLSIRKSLDSGREEPTTMVVNRRHAAISATVQGLPRMKPVPVRELPTTTDGGILLTWTLSGIALELKFISPEGVQMTGVVGRLASTTDVVSFVSDAQGSVRIRSIQPHDAYAVDLSDPFFAIDGRDRALLVVEPSSLTDQCIIIRVVRGRELHGVVHDRTTGAPVSMLDLEFERTGTSRESTQRVATTDSYGRFVLSAMGPGVYRVKTASDDFSIALESHGVAIGATSRQTAVVRVQSDGRQLLTLDQGPWPSLDLEVCRSCVVTGEVFGFTGQSELRVQALWYAGPASSPRALSETLRTLDRSGRFRIDGIPSGTFDFVLRDSKQILARIPHVEVSPLKRNHVRMDAPMPSTLVIEFSGRALPTSEWRVNVRTNDPAFPVTLDSDPLMTMTCDGDSEMELGPLAPGHYQIELVAEGNSVDASRRALVLSPGQETRARYVVDPVDVIYRGRVLFDSGAPLEGLNVVRLVDNVTSKEHVVRTKIDGTFQVALPVPGDLVVTSVWKTAKPPKMFSLSEPVPLSPFSMTDVIIH